MKSGDPNKPSQQHQVQQSDAQRGRREASANEKKTDNQPNRQRNQQGQGRDQEEE